MKRLENELRFFNASFQHENTDGSSRVLSMQYTMGLPPPSFPVPSSVVPYDEHFAV